MSDQPKPQIGSIVWRDLTVPDATGLADFYKKVVGWQMRDHDMGDYNDYDVVTPGGETVAGICHARGSNANVPPQWMVYVTVENVDDSAARCQEEGGTILDGPREMGGHRFCVIQDPAGAVLGLIA